MKNEKEEVEIKNNRALVDPHVTLKIENTKAKLKTKNLNLLLRKRATLIEVSTNNSSTCNYRDHLYLSSINQTLNYEYIEFSYMFCMLFVIFQCQHTKWIKNTHL